MWPSRRFLGSCTDNCTMGEPREFRPSISRWHCSTHIIHKCSTTLVVGIPSSLRPEHDGEYLAVLMSGDTAKQLSADSLPACVLV